MSRKLYDEEGNPEVLDGMETFHPDHNHEATLVDRPRHEHPPIGSAYNSGPSTSGREDVEGKRALRPPHSAYPLSALPAGTEHYGSDPEGTIGVHHPKEIVRIERDWSGGDVCQFYTSWVMELEGRVTPVQCQALINDINHHLQMAYSTRSAIWEGLLALCTWQTSLFWYTSRFERELKNIEKIIENANRNIWNVKGLNVLSPRSVAFQFLEIEYY